MVTSSHDYTLHNARVTIPVFAIGCLPTTITVNFAHSCSPFFIIFAGILLWYFVLEFGRFGKFRFFSHLRCRGCASNFNIGRSMSIIHHLKAWQRTVQLKIDEVMVWNHSSCLRGAQDPLQVIQLENPEKIWLFCRSFVSFVFIFAGGMPGN
jgi:hypothetical protein